MLLRKFRGNGAIVYLLTNISNAAIPFVLLPILTRFLTKDEFAQLAMFQLVIVALSGIIGINTIGAASRRYFDKNISTTDLQRYNSACILLAVVSFLFVLFAFFQSRIVLSEMLGLSESAILKGVFCSFCSFIIIFRLNQFQIRKKAFKYGILSISNSMINLVLSVLFVVFMLLGVNGRVNAQLIAFTIFAIISLWSLYDDNIISIKSFPVKKDYFSALSFGLPLLPHVLGGMLLTTFDRYIINDLLGGESTAIYMLGVQVSLAVKVIFDAINKVFMPYLFLSLKNDCTRNKEKIVRFTYLLFPCSIVFVLLLYNLAPYLINFIAGNSYSGATNIVVILIIGQLFCGYYLMFTNYIFYEKKTGYLSLITIICGVINVLLSYYLVINIGVVGAAISFALIMFIRFFIVMCYAVSFGNMPWLKIVRS